MTTNYDELEQEIKTLKFEMSHSDFVNHTALKRLKKLEKRFSRKPQKINFPTLKPCNDGSGLFWV